MRRTQLALFAMSLLFVLSGCVGGGNGNGGNSGPTPVNFKIAFIADSTIGSNADAVLNLILSENAEMVIHAGDLDYVDNPPAFEDNVNGILGADYPYFYSAGNHDVLAWDGADGYRTFLEARFNRLGIPWNGEIGTKSNFTYQGIFFFGDGPRPTRDRPDRGGRLYPERVGGQHRDLVRRLLAQESAKDAGRRQE